MNYIKHLNGIVIQFSKDNRLNPTHISLYFALFQFWNFNRFPAEFHISREEIMKLSKIGSTATYHKCIKQLDHWNYLKYKPSHNPFKGSKVQLFNFESSSKAVINLDRSLNEQALIPNININKHKINFIKLEATAKEKLILDFFKKEKYSELEAKKFFNHYQGIGWKVGGKSKIVDWQATAKSWMLKANEMKLTTRPESREKNNPNALPLDHFQDNLHVNQNKRYDIPL